MSSDAEFRAEHDAAMRLREERGREVLCRNSLVTARAPSSTGNTYPIDEAKL
jgi:hypothetical protein